LKCNAEVGNGCMGTATVRGHYSQFADRLPERKSPSRPRCPGDAAAVLPCLRGQELWPTQLPWQPRGLALLHRVIGMPLGCPCMTDTPETKIMSATFQRRCSPFGTKFILIDIYFIHILYMKILPKK
jgi:hypothetical protein